jgi:hypothetical protein
MATSTHLDVLTDVLFTFEARFTRDDTNSTRNTDFLAHENPNELEERYFERRFPVNVWSGLLGSYLVVPHFIKGGLTAACYRDFL